MKPLAALILAALAVLPPASPGVEPVVPAARILVCAPGFPGSPEEAQEVMDDFARVVAAAAERPEGTVLASYSNAEEGCLNALRGGSIDLVLSTSPFLAKYRAELELHPAARVVPTEGRRGGVVALAARKGALSGPQDLDGWTVAGLAGYADRWVRNEVLASWGELPSDLTIRYEPRILSALRKAAAGEPIAVLLDGAQQAALPSLPFAGELEIVHRSGPVDGQWVATVGSSGQGPWMVDALLRLHDHSTAPENAAEVFSTMEIERIERLASP